MVGVLDDFKKKINILQVHMGKIKIPAQVHRTKRNTRTDSRLEAATLKKCNKKYFIILCTSFYFGPRNNHLH